MSTNRGWLGRALAAGLVTATTIATPIAVGAEHGGIAEPDTYTVAEDSDLTEIANFFNVLANDLASPEGPTVIDSYTQGTYGTVGEVRTNGDIVRLTYVPNPNSTETDTFTYSVTGQDGRTEAATVTVNITPSQDAPVAEDDALPSGDAVIVENGEVVDIYAAAIDNDRDVDGDAFIISSIDTEGTAGTVAFDVDAQTLTYQATSDSATTDSFTYVITDTEANDSLAATVNITITAVDDAPVAASDGVESTLELAEGGSLLIDVVANDVDLDGEPVIIDPDSISTPDHGSAVLEGNKIRYTHDGGETTADGFTYSVLGGNTATVSLTINETGDFPVAVIDGDEEPFAEVPEGGSVVLDVMANDTDVDGTDDNVITAITGVPDGHDAIVIAEGDDAGKIQYTHDGHDLADITFSYTLNGGTSADVWLSVKNETDDPFTVAAVPTVETEEDAESTTIPVLTADQKDGDGDDLALSAVGTDGVNKTEEGVNLGIDPEKGTAQLIDVEGVKTLVYTPTEDANGEDTFTVEVSDGTTGDEVTVTITVNIAAVNDAPVAGTDVYSNTSANDAAANEVTSVLVLEDTATLLPVLSNDSDTEENALTVDLSNTELASDIGTLEVVDGGVLFTPKANYFGEFTFTYEAVESSTDPALRSDPVTVSVTVVAQPDAIAAVDDVDEVVEEDDVMYVSVLGNDIDNDGFDLSVVSFDQPEHGFVAMAGDRIRVEPDPNFHGELTFTYTIMASDRIDYDETGVIEISCDDETDCDTATATVIVNVTPVNDRPEAKADTGIETIEDEAISIDVLDNDSDVDGDELSIGFVGSPDLGSAEIVDGEVLYTPDANVFGDDEFVYFTFDGTALSYASVSLTITPVDDAPTIEDVSTNGTEDTNVVVELTVDDVDPDNESLTISIGDVTGGTATVEGATLTFTPTKNWVGIAQIPVTVTDDKGMTGEGLISIDVEAVNDAPIIDDEVAETDEDNAVSIPMTFSDVEDEELSIEIGVSPDNGIVAVDGRSVTYTPADDFYGENTFTVTTTDSGGETATATVTVDVKSVNDAPVIDDEVAETDEDNAVSIPMTFSDIEDEELSIEIGYGRLSRFAFIGWPGFPGDEFGLEDNGLPSNGTATVEGGSVVYTPDENFYGEDTFTVTTTDSAGESTSATVTVTVNPVNDAPVIDDEAVDTDEDEAVFVSMTFSDVEDGPFFWDGPELFEEEGIFFETPLTLSIEDGPTNGTAEIDGDGVTYTPSENFNGDDSFTVTVTDSEGATATATVNVTVNAVNDTPVIDNATAETDEDHSVSIPMTFSDIEDEELTIEIGDGDLRKVLLVGDEEFIIDGLFTIDGYPSNGTATVQGGNVVYTPSENFNGDDSFTVTVTDSEGARATATVNITVNAVNDAPVIDNAAATTNEDNSVSIPITASDIEDQSVTVQIGQGPSNGTAAMQDGKAVYTPAANFNGQDSFTVTTTDSGGASATATVTINVGAINDVPTAQPCASVTVESGMPLVIDVGPCGDDVDGDILQAESATATKGNAGKSGLQTVTYTSAAGYVGADTVTITLTDGNGGSVDVSVDVTVTAPANPYIGAEAVEGQVVRIYSAMLGRMPDAGGFAFWVNARNEGMSLGRMIEMFADSPEFRQTFGDRIAEDTDEQWVSFVYLEIMGRTPDAGGQAFWLDMLRTGRATRSWMVVAFAESPEFQNLTQTS